MDANQAAAFSAVAGQPQTVPLVRLSSTASWSMVGQRGSWHPPYVEYSKVKSEYTVRGYQTESCGNLYAFVMEQFWPNCYPKADAMG